MKKRLWILVLCGAVWSSAGWMEDAYDSTAKSASQAYDGAKNLTKETGSYWEAKSKEAYFDAKKSAKEIKKDAEKKYKDYEDGKELEITNCVKDLEATLPQYSLFLEQHYMLDNKYREEKILNSYKALNKKGISIKLQNSVSSELLNKLQHSTSTIEYMATVISGLKTIQSRLKEQNPDEVKSLVKEAQFLMFAWTAPMEIFATKNIYDASLVGMSKPLNITLDKDNYINYSNYVYSLLFVNLLKENIIIDKDRTKGVALKLWFTYGLYRMQDEIKGVKEICEDILGNMVESSNPHDYILNNLSNNFNIEREVLKKKVNAVSEKKTIFENSIIFSKIKPELKEINIIDNPLNDSWYFMIREYTELQDNFYNSKKEIDKIIKILSVLPDAEKEIAILKQNIFDVDALYRKLDGVVRYNIIELPVIIYADLYSIQLAKAKEWYDVDESKIEDIAVAYNKSCANMQQYISSEFALERALHTLRLIKKELNEEELEQAKTRAKMTQDWLNMLNKVEVKNK